MHSRIERGDKFLIRDQKYIVCRIQGLFYLVNIETGGTWTHGLEHNQLIQESIKYNFVRI